MLQYCTVQYRTGNIIVFFQIYEFFFKFSQTNLLSLDFFTDNKKIPRANLRWYLRTYVRITEGKVNVCTLYQNVSDLLISILD